MIAKSNRNTKEKIKLGDVARILSGVYAKGNPTGKIACLQIKDLQMSSPQTTAMRIEYAHKLDSYMLKKGGLAFCW